MNYLNVMMGAVLGLALATPSMASVRTVTVHNKSKDVMVAFYASNTGTSSWEEDILGADVLASGDSLDVDIDDGTGACRFDLRADYQDGSKAIQENFNVCTESSITFTD